VDHARRMAQYQEAIRQEPGDPANWRGLCRAAEALHVWPEVLTAIDRLVPLTDDRAVVARLHAKKADVLERGVADLGRARTHYEKAMQGAPGWVWPYLALATIDLRERRWNRAIAHANHGLELAPGDARERPWLQLVKAIAGQRVSVSLGPQSSFFRALRSPQAPAAPDPSTAAFLDARARLPELAGMSPEAFLTDGATAIAFVVERCPRPTLDLL
jgi:hypothetical protein